MKVIAFYLPQFHSIPENDKWWGKGFTEWVNVKQAKKLFEGHYQPRIPLNNNYYCLTDDNTLEWQIKIAKEYGIYGFCIYHYWFEGHKLLEKPLEKLRDNSELNIPYCICWANESWTNAWVANGDVKTLIKQTYGGRDEWKNHFDYLLTFFKDKNYITNNGKPLLVIYRPELIENLNTMLDYWNELAIVNGLNGIDFAYQQISFSLQKKEDDSRFKYDIEYQPGYARFDLRNNQSNKLKLIAFKFRTRIRNLALLIDRKFNMNITGRLTKNQLKIEDYDQLCKAIIARKPESEKSVPGMFVGWDNTPRRGSTGTVCVNSSPEKFKYYLTKQILNAKNNYKKNMIFLFAWNEWAEGGYIEPDEKYSYKYLEAIKDALVESNEFI